MKFCTFRLIRFAVILPLMIAAAVSFVLTACMPEWVDADSCIYVTLDGKVMVRDVNAKKSKEIATLEANDVKTGFSLKILKLSPKRDQFVIARLTIVDKESKLNFDFYSLSGMKIDSSDSIKVGESADGFNLFNVNWSSDGMYVLASSMGQPFTVSYHTEKKTHRVHRSVGYMLPRFGLWPSTNPITPDGKSFVGMQADAFYLISLESGEELHKFEMSDPLEKILKSFGSNDPQVVFPAYWRGNVLVQPVFNGELKFDVVSKSVDFAVTDRMKKLVKHAESGERAVVGEINENLIVELKKTGTKGMAEFDLSIFNLETESREKLDSLKSVTMLDFVKSPDGKRVMLSVTTGGQQVSVVVLDNAGDLVDEFAYPTVHLKK